MQSRIACTKESLFEFGDRENEVYRSSMGAIGTKSGRIHLSEKFPDLFGREFLSRADGTVARHGGEYVIANIFELICASAVAEIDEGIAYERGIVVVDEAFGNRAECVGMVAEFVDLESEFFEEIHVFSKNIGQPRIELKQQREQQSLGSRRENIVCHALESLEIDSFVGRMLIDDDDGIAIGADQVCQCMLSDVLETRKVSMRFAGFEGQTRFRFIADFAAQLCRRKPKLRHVCRRLFEVIG